MPLASRRAIAAAATALLLVLPACAAAAPPAEHLRALARLTERHGGDRVAGSPGYTAAVGYVARTLRAAGYAVRRQPVSFPYFETLSPSRLRVDGVRLRRGRDYRTLSRSGAGDVRGPLRPVALRFGRERASGCAAADFRALQAGEVALVQRGVCELQVKAANARKAGAVAVLIANDGRPGLRRAFLGTLRRVGGIPALALSSRAGRALAGHAGEIARVEVDAISERRTADNVIAERPGARGRVLMAGGHLDSVRHAPGMNDNGSGVAALLSLAQRRRGERGLRFGFWTAEELGLYGSKHYVRSLSRAERRRIAGYVNLDMIGSPNPEAEVYGRDWLRPRLTRAVRGVGLDPVFTRIGDLSDHAPFAKAGIPVGGLHTGAFERAPNGRPHDRCYHEPCDDLGNVDLRMLDRLTDATNRVLLRP